MKKICLYRLLFMCSAMFFVQTSFAQVVGNKYKEDNSSIEITHKAAKWFDLRKYISESAKAMDTFDDGTTMFTLQDGITQVQAAHTYMDTIYVHKGTSVVLEIPDKLGTQIRVESYQRWHSFRTDGTFRTKNTGANEVWDLLTPFDGNTYYRYANGYVGKPKGGNLYKVNFYVPTDEEFQEWFGEESAQKYDNNYFLVACDVSAYTDYTKNYSSTSSSSSFGPSKEDGKTYEPTVTHRILFYIVTVDNRDSDPTVTWQNGMGRLKNKDYQGGTLESGKKYLEEYDISFPFTRVSNKTLELVVLSKDAWSYAIPDATIADDHSTLDLHLADNGSGITLDKTTISGMNRIIQFKYPQNNSLDGTQYVNANNSSATIYVTKTVNNVTYNIARFNLTFIRDTRLLTQTQVKQIEEGSIADENMKYYQFRTNSYLEKNYQLLTSLDFDYDPAVAEIYGQPEFYPFPIAWTANSYSFFDGAEGNDFKNTNKYPEWGYYSIMSSFMEADHWNNGTRNEYAAPLPGSTYHLYVDASDRPGVIARLPFERKLCKGTELFVTAWLKSAGWGSGMADANMLFSIMGVKTDSVLGTVYEPIYRHSSSQVRRTDYLSKMPGTGPNTNEWMQMYFSFIVDRDTEYDSYVLQIDNNSASTDGGDMYIDDIRVYFATPSATVKQLEATCTNERTMMSIQLDWGRLMSRLGHKDGDTGIEAIDFCFIDQVKYDSYLADNPDDYQGAIEASVVEIGNNEQGEGFYNEKYNTLYFNLEFDKNTDYDVLPHPCLAKDNEIDGKYYFYRTVDNAGTKGLIVDFYSLLSPNRDYRILIQINDGNPASASDFAEDINDKCAINTSFFVTAQTLLRINGEAVDPTTDYCSGQLFKFDASLRVPIGTNDDGTPIYTEVKEGVFFDWFFGTEDEFTEAKPEFGGVSLEEALLQFRDIFPDRDNIDGVEAGIYEIVDGYKVELTQNQIDIIDHYVNVTNEIGNLNNKLVLHREQLDITLLESGFKLVLQPIPLLQSPDGSIDADLWAKVCWSYIPLVLNVTGDAPQLRAGYNAIKYPSDDFNPGLRIGLNQIIKANNADNVITVNLRGAKLVTEGADYLGMVTSINSEVYNKLYLIHTDDPEYGSFFNSDFNEFSLPIGTITYLYAEPYLGSEGFNDNMKIYFDLNTMQANGFKFNPKEGYTYTFAVHFEEKVAEGSEIGNACFGQFNVDMKVVPEFLVWKGTGNNSNWNNDNNWKRADRTDLKKTDNSYPTNADNTTDNGFVPMLFSNVVMPQNSNVELYMAGFGDGGTGWVNNSRPSYMELPTENIQYDLMTYENDGALSTQRYRVNICRDVHFEPSSCILHAEQLLYNKIWTDIEVTDKNWTALSIPIKGVVAGDFYTPASGKQNTEYFKDITFTQDYSRLNPAVYQRTWSLGANIVESQTEGQTTNIPVSFGYAEWSAVYNDTYVPYLPGSGFSLKTVAQPISDNKVLFRLPKADETYPVTSVGGNIDRSDVGKLAISDLVDRSNPYQYVTVDEITMKVNTSADDNFIMVGNPFMAMMDVQAFMQLNADVLQQQYWYINSNGTYNAVTYNQETGLWSEANYLAAPYSVFYVRKHDYITDNTGTVDLKFNADMQQLTLPQNETTESSVMTIKAITDNNSSEMITSVATVAYSTQADNGYVNGEDAELIANLDANAGNLPLVYTVAGNKALTANMLRNTNMIPLGVHACNDGVVTLEFEGVNNIGNAMIYDAELGTKNNIYDGYTLTVDANTNGRYFIVSDRDVTGISDTEYEQINVSSVIPNQIVVTSTGNIKSLALWTSDGKLIKKLQPDKQTCTINGIHSGLIIVSVNYNTFKKIMVK